MSRISKKLANAIRKQTTAYNAYCVAIAEQDANGVVVWAGMLLEAQAITGVEMRRPEVLEEQICRYRAKYAKAG